MASVLLIMDADHMYAPMTPANPYNFRIFHMSFPRKPQLAGHRGIMNRIARTDLMVSWNEID